MKLISKLLFFAILIGSITTAVWAAAQYMAACTEKGCDWKSGWSSNRDTVNSQAKDHERATKGHRWTIKEK